MTEEEHCSRCGEALTSEVPGGLCPRCVMQMNLAPDTLDTLGGGSSAMPPLPPEKLADKFPQFELIECLGRGGMGIVYKARQKTLDRLVAIKILAGEWQGKKGFRERFEKEAKLLAQLSNSNIVTVHDFGETDGLFYIVMEYVDGVNLRDLLREGKMIPEQALAIVSPVCEALEYAHEMGVVHRDIKPENLLLDRNGRVKIADFGIASLAGATGEKSGTPPYMSPEQERGVVDKRGDIYALGAVLYEMLTGERPQKDVVPPSRKVEVDIRIDEMVLRAMEKEPERRYQTAGEFRAIVQTLQTPVADRADAEPHHSPRFSRRFVVRAALIVGLIGIVIVLGLKNAGVSQRDNSGDSAALPPTNPKDAAVWNQINLFGVLPDGGSEIFDARGNRTGEGPAIGPWQWDDDAQGSALIFDVPDDVLIQWEIFPEVRVSETGWRLGGSMTPWTADYLGKKRRIQTLEIDRSYQEKGVLGDRTIPVEKIDLTLRYHLPGRRDAVGTFHGPFKVGQATKAEEGFACTITPSVDSGSPGSGTKFHLSSIDAPIAAEDYRQVLAYDHDGKRHLVESEGGRIQGVGSNRSSADRHFRIAGLPLSRLATITIGEHPQRKTFRNVSLRPPGRSPRPYPLYLDMIATRLGLSGVPPGKLQEYKFTGIDEVLKVIDVVQGRHLDRVWQVIKKTDFSTLSDEQLEKLHVVAQRWTDDGQVLGVLLGLKGQWEEFVDAAMQLIQQPSPDRSTIVSALQTYRDFTPEQLTAIAQTLEAVDDRRGLAGLLWCLNQNRRRPGGREALERIAGSGKVWLWWPAMESLTGSGGLTLVQLDRGLQIKYLAMTSPDRGLDDDLAARARLLLSSLPSAQLSTMSIGTMSDVLRSVGKNLPRAEAGAVMLDLLEDMVEHWDDPTHRQQRYEHSSWWPIDRAVRQLNHWHDLDIGGLGSDVDRETRNSGRIDWPGVARQALEHFGREVAPPLTNSAGSETSRIMTVRLIDLLGQSLAHAVLDLRPAGLLRYPVPREPLAGGQRIRVQTDAHGRARIEWPRRSGDAKVFELVGTATHPDYGRAPVSLRPSASPQQVPFLPKASVRYGRALCGQVVDESGQPVAGALIGSNEVRSNGARHSGRGEAITNSTGRFIMPFDMRSGGDPQRPIPGDAIYTAVARAPSGVDLFPTRARGSGPLKLVLRAPTLAPRQLRFEIGESEYAGEADFSRIRIEWAPADDLGSGILLGSRYVGSEAVRLTPGRYLARFSDGHGRRFDYPPLVIDANSPEVITFKRPPAVTYSGRVIDGDSEQPVSGALVFLFSAITQHSNLAMLSEADWDILDAMPDEPSSKNPGVKILNRHYPIEGLVRTDVEGGYTIRRGRENMSTSLIVLARDRLPFKIQLNKLVADAKQQVKVPQNELFPAAYVRFVPDIPVGLSPSVHIKWKLEPEGQPDWFVRFKAVEGAVRSNNWLDLGAPVRAFVPAGLNFKLDFGVSSSSEVRPIPPDRILKLGAREILDLGELKFVAPEDAARPHSGSNAQEDSPRPVVERTTP